VESVLPKGQEDWDAVGTRFNRAAQTQRTVSSLRTKFKTLASAKKPTGDTAPSASVVRAKTIRDKIELACRAEVMTSLPTVATTPSLPNTLTTSDSPDSQPEDETQFDDLNAATQEFLSTCT
jgi:hypothetical protein